MILTFGFFLLILIQSLFAQTPQAFKYQAIARDGDSQILANSDIYLRISIIEGSIDGKIIYTEIHQNKTNQFGLFSLEIGKGISNNNFSEISWGMAPRHRPALSDRGGGGPPARAVVWYLFSPRWRSFVTPQVGSFEP